MLVASSTQSSWVGVAGSTKLHAGPIVDTEPSADLIFDQANGIRDSTAFLEGRVGAFRLLHQRRDFRNILGMEVEGGFHLAGVGVADFHGIAIRRRHVEFGEVLFRGAVTVMRKAATLTAAKSRLTRTRTCRIEISTEISIPLALF